jgi:hypothetical protein
LPLVGVTTAVGGALPLVGVATTAVGALPLAGVATTVVFVVGVIYDVFVASVLAGAAAAPIGSADTVGVLDGPALGGGALITTFGGGTTGFVVGVLPPQPLFARAVGTVAALTTVAVGVPHAC